MIHTTIVILLLCNRLITAVQVDDDLDIGKTCTDLLKAHGVEDHLIGASTFTQFHFFSADETKQYTCFPVTL